VLVRDAKEEGASDVAVIPVTVRQLEALVLNSESLACMELASSCLDLRTAKLMLGVTVHKAPCQCRISSDAGEGCEGGRSQ
jgi:hypothetical protein